MSSITPSLALSFSALTIVASKQGTMSTHGSKRAINFAEETGKALKKARRESAALKNNEEAPTGMPLSVFPLIWNFLLEPGNTNPKSTNPGNACIDFKSIASFMLVSKAAKEAFNSCNGWAHCVRAVGKEIFARKEYLENFRNRVQPFLEIESLNDEEFQRFQSLVSENCTDASPVFERLYFIQKKLLPEAKRLVILYCRRNALLSRVFKEIKSSDEEDGIAFLNTVALLNGKVIEELSTQVRDLADAVAQLNNNDNEDDDSNNDGDNEQEQV